MPTVETAVDLIVLKETAPGIQAGRTTLQPSVDGLRLIRPAGRTEAAILLATQLGCGG